MGIKIRTATSSDAEHLPAIEKSASESFRDIPELEWIAEDEVMNAEAHQRHIGEGSVWVAEAEDSTLVGFLSAEADGARAAYS